MTFKELKNKIKEEQKTLAQEIKEYKAERKSSPYGYVAGLYERQRDYRYTHIAYCEFFNNTPYEKIEKPRDDNRPSRRWIDDDKIIWAGKIGGADETM
jgi:hypothetical protein